MLSDLFDLTLIYGYNLTEKWEWQGRHDIRTGVKSNVAVLLFCDEK